MYVFYPIRNSLEMSLNCNDDGGWLVPKKNENNRKQKVNKEM